MNIRANQVTETLGDRQRLAQENIDAARRRGLAQLVAEDTELDGRHITIAGRRVVNFGSCSYLGLESDERVKAGACDAIMRYGTQFSSSRAYVSAPPYAELQQLLSRIAGGRPVVIAPTTSLGHQSALPVLIEPGDAVVFDAQVHSSVQAVIPTLVHHGIPCKMLGHNRLDQLEHQAKRLAREHRRVFYLCDGVYSMHGDAVDVPGLLGVLERVPQLFAYIDDAHGVGWAGKRGAGIVLGEHDLHERMVVVLGLAKGFGAGGAAIVFPSEDLARRVVTSGGPMVFSGPLQPPLLGAAIASAKILLSPELEVLQDKVRTGIERFDALAHAEGLPLVDSDATPIRFIEIGDEERTLDLAAQLRDRGYFINIAVFPAVPRRRAGLRMMVSARHELEDIDGLLETLGRLMRDGQPGQQSGTWSTARAHTSAPSKSA